MVALMISLGSHSSQKTPDQSKPTTIEAAFSKAIKGRRVGTCEHAEWNSSTSLSGNAGLGKVFCAKDGCQKIVPIHSALYGRYCCAAHVPRTEVNVDNRVKEDHSRVQRLVDKADKVAGGLGRSRHSVEGKATRSLKAKDMPITQRSKQGPVDGPESKVSVAEEMSALQSLDNELVGQQDRIRLLLGRLGHHGIGEVEREEGVASSSPRQLQSDLNELSELEGLADAQQRQISDMLGRVRDLTMNTVADTVVGEPQAAPGSSVFTRPLQSAPAYFDYDEETKAFLREYSVLMDTSDESDSTHHTPEARHDNASSAPDLDPILKPQAPSTLADLREMVKQSRVARGGTTSRHDMVVIDL